MTNTYKEDVSIQIKIYEEMRCLRCVLERLLRVADEGLFVDYQLEKFGKNYKQQEVKKNEKVNYSSVAQSGQSAGLMLVHTLINGILPIPKRVDRGNPEVTGSNPVAANANWSMSNPVGLTGCNPVI